MRNFIKNKKKKGFTLIEMVAVVAIIGILAAILVPKITGYMKEAKKTGVIDQARKVSQAYETADMKDKLKEADGTTATTKNLLVPGSTGSTVVTNKTMLSLIDNAPLDKIKGADIQQCLNITNGVEFNVNGNGELVLTSVPTTPVTP